MHLSLRTSTLQLGTVLMATVLFLFATQFRQPTGHSSVKPPEGKVVIAAPIQILMYAGDKFLAANLEVMRVAAIGPSEENALANYRGRALEVASQLNPCHEDNVYLANAMLSWGGLTDEGNTVLQVATECRFWDDIPPFFLGFNRYFFYRDLDGAKQAIDIAAERSEENRATLQKMAIMMSAKKLNDEKMALAYLRNQRDQAADPQLKEMLDRRLLRLEGLLTLRDAQARFEKQQGHPLKNPDDLLSSGILEAFPHDPMRLGYEFVEGRFRLRSFKVGELEIHE